MMQYAGNPKGVRRGSDVEDAVFTKWQASSLMFLYLWQYGTCIHVIKQTYNKDGTRSRAGALHVKLHTFLS
jgi:hypothetical protein